MEWNGTTAESFQIDPFVVAFQADLTMVGQLFTVACVVISRRKPQKPGDTMCLNDVYKKKNVPEALNFQVLVSIVHKGQEDLKPLSFCKSLAMGEMQKVGVMPCSRRIISLILHTRP